MQTAKLKSPSSKVWSIPAYFQHFEKREMKQSKQPDLSKMGENEKKKPQPKELDTPTKADYLQLLKRIDKLEGGLLEKFTSLMKPLPERLDQLTNNL